MKHQSLSLRIREFIVAFIQAQPAAGLKRFTLGTTEQSNLLSTVTGRQAILIARETARRELIMERAVRATPSAGGVRGQVCITFYADSHNPATEPPAAVMSAQYRA